MRICQPRYRLPDKYDVDGRDLITHRELLWRSNGIDTSGEYSETYIAKFRGNASVTPRIDYRINEFPRFPVCVKEPSHQNVNIKEIGADSALHYSNNSKINNSHYRENTDTVTPRLMLLGDFSNCSFTSKGKCATSKLHLSTTPRRTPKERLNSCKEEASSKRFNAMKSSYSTSTVPTLRIPLSVTRLDTNLPSNSAERSKRTNIRDSHFFSKLRSNELYLTNRAVQELHLFERMSEDLQIFNDDRFVLSLPTEEFLNTADRISKGILKLGQLGSHYQLETVRRNPQRMYTLSENDFNTNKGRKLCRQINRLIHMLDEL